MNEILTAIEKRLDRIEQLTLIGAKPVLNFDEAVAFTGLSKGHMYRLTSGHEIPYYKKCRKLYFKKSELEKWLMEKHVPTNDEVRRQAETYLSTHKRPGL